MYKIAYSKQAAKDIKNLKAAGLEKKTKESIAIMKKDPFSNPPEYEALVGNLKGFFSRRINIQHRLVYQIVSEPLIENGIEYDGVIKIVRMWTHYE